MIKRAPAYQNGMDQLNDNAKKAFNSFIKMNLIAIPGIAVPTAIFFGTFARHEHLPPSIKIGLALVVFGSVALCSMEVGKLAKIAVENNVITKNRPEKGFTAETMSPLRIALTPNEKKLLTKVEKDPQLLLSGDEGKPVEDLSADPILALAEQRIDAITFVGRHLLDKQIKGNSPNGPQERNEILLEVGRTVASWPSSFGLSLTKKELNMLIDIVSQGSVLELAPETISGYAKVLGHILESYILNLRVDSSGKSMNEDLLSIAVRSEKLTGKSVSPPIELWVEAKRIEAMENEKVTITDDQAIKIAKSITAIKHTAIPEAIPVIDRTLQSFEGLLTSELKRQSGKPKESVIRDLIMILSVSLERAIGKDSMSKLAMIFHGFGSMTEAQSFGAPFENLRSAKSIMRAFGKSEFGNVTVDERGLVIEAENIALADTLCCVVGTLFPHFESIEIRTQQDGVIHLSMEAFYRTRLMHNDRGYLRRMFKLNSNDLQVVQETMPRLQSQ